MYFIDGNFSSIVAREIIGQFFNIGKIDHWWKKKKPVDEDLCFSFKV